MSPADWRCIARFVVAQDLRTPQDFIEWYARFQQTIQESLEAAIQKLPERIARQQAGSHSEGDATDGSQDFMRDVFKISIDRSQATNGMVPVRADVRSARSVWMRRVQHLLVNRAEVVCEHRWCTMIPAAGEDWPLTDHPVLRLNFNSPQEYDFGGGWGHPGSEFIMPVSPRLAVYTQVGKRHHGPIRLDAAKTRQLQQLFVERAYRWILAREPIPWFEAFRPRTAIQSAIRSGKVWTAMLPETTVLKKACSFDGCTGIMHFHDSTACFVVWSTALNEVVAVKPLRQSEAVAGTLPDAALARAVLADALDAGSSKEVSTVRDQVLSRIRTPRSAWKPMRSVRQRHGPPGG